MNAYFFERLAAPDAPGGITVSKQHKLPDGYFAIEEFTWGSVSLWFVAEDHFTADERQAAFESLRVRP